MQLPPNCLIMNPAGSYSFVGRVDARLGYVRKDGTPASDVRAREIIAGDSAIPEQLW